MNIIRHAGPISRTELAEMTDYRPATIGAIIKDLLDKKLIVETGRSTGGQGRKRTLLEINKTRLCAIGISFSLRSALCIATGIDGRIFCQEELPITQGLPKHLLAGQITDAVSRLLDNCKGKEIVGIGVCRPFYDPLAYEYEHSLQANYTHFHDWIHHSLIPDLRSRTNISVETFSPGTLPVLAEQKFGVAKGARDFLFIEMGNGIGASLFCNGEAVKGSCGLAGEIGHTVVNSDINQTLCYCGKPNCVEGMSAYPALAAKMRQALERGVFSELRIISQHQDFTVKDVRQALDRGDRMCTHFVKEAAQKLGVAIANAVNLLNPELVVLHGYMLDLGDYFLTQLENSIRENTMSLSNTFDIRISASVETILPLGAAAELFEEYLKTDHYKWVYQIPTNEQEEIQ